MKIMPIKFAYDIIKEIINRGKISVKNDCVTGEEFEKWLRGENMNCVIHNVANIHIGKPVTSNNRGEHFNLTDGEQYVVIGFDGDCIKIKNDIGKEELYSLEYFYEFEELFW